MSGIRSLFALKVQLMQSPKNYLLYMITPGTFFDANRMQVYSEKPGSNAVPDNARTPKRVKFCIFPGLVEHDWQLPILDEGATMLEIDEAVPKITVDGKRFLPTDDSPLKNPVVVAKASVFLEEGTEEEFDIGKTQVVGSETRLQDELAFLPDQSRAEREQELCIDPAILHL
ncbi:hypothetical protein K491DRAFT_718717 [Lophiostoma macrostomum CBS 122681]|uniref:Uncharacterized protein n=1 Tax=Lophiostoma macrostomum CBS 122681 TaxID=1314788 RepID=A0A6A6T037_9PLEO|nr:hypothetical protein K491DRAFT_718717 [Lophiostoma macrostomum CBS 122681]